MPKPSPITKSYHKAHESLNKSFQIALDKMGRVPFGHDIIDPRTRAARQEREREIFGNIAFNSNIVGQKPVDMGKHLPAKPTVQDPRVAAAGKVVDPSSQEIAQSTDNVTLSADGGMSNDLGG